MKKKKRPKFVNILGQLKRANKHRFRPPTEEHVCKIFTWSMNFI